MVEMYVELQESVSICKLFLFKVGYGWLMFSMAHMAPQRWQRQRHEHCRDCRESWPPMGAMRGLFATCVSRKSWSQVAPRQGENIAE